MKEINRIRGCRKVKRAILKRVTTLKISAVWVMVLALVALCNDAFANSLDNIENSTLRRYTASELERGAPSLDITSKVLYREALVTLEKGNWEAAREKLLLSASLSGEYSAPLFTLARIELLHAHPDFLFHLLGGITREMRSFHGQSLAAANAVVLIASALLISLLIVLVMLLARYWTLLDHKVRETYSKKFAFPDRRAVSFLLVAGLLFMRLGLAIYLALLIILLWNIMNRREKSTVATLASLLTVISILSPLSNRLAPAVDVGSITRRLSMIDERGSDTNLINSVSEIDDPAFRAEKDFAIGTLLYRLDRLDEAKTYLLSSVSIRGDMPGAYLNLGNVYFKQADYTRALAGYRNVLAIDSTSTLAYYNIGQTYIKMMLFAESSSALKKANELGIDGFRRLKPATHLKNLPVYDTGFTPSDLWNISIREGKGRSRVLLGEIVHRSVLFPFQWVGFLIIGAFICAIFLGKARPALWQVSKCDNCGRATCSECADTETGINLCRECSGVINGLTSVKVMEALLRHKRRRISAARKSRTRWLLVAIPGGVQIFHGNILRGLFSALLGSAALLTLAWTGPYFKDPGVINISVPIWKIVAPLSVMAFLWLAAIRTKPPQETRKIRILPTDFQVEAGKAEDRPDRSPDRRNPGPSAAEKIEDPFGAFLDTL